MPLREQLQQHLGAAYTLEQELGGGGMSRVFVAEDEALGRKVVIKVLPPELTAGVNVERFNREILLAVKLQHPHIVPMHSAGDMDGLPWFTIHFVGGESLRARLARGPLGTTEAVGLLHGIVIPNIAPTLNRSGAWPTSFARDVRRSWRQRYASRLPRIWRRRRTAYRTGR